MVTTPLHVRVASGVVLASLTSALVLSRTSSSASARPVTPAEAREVYASITEKERDERAQAARKFPSSLWSQDDDFHNRENRMVRDYAKTHGVAIQSVLDALDDGMHEKWPTEASEPPNPSIVPCRPRLTY